MRFGDKSMHVAMKRMLLGTSLGRTAITIRNLYELVRTPPVALGTVVNDQLASRLIVELCPEDGTFVDVGAHIGSIIADVSFRRPAARIIAFEAIPDKADALRRKFPHMDIHCCAVVDEGTETETTFFIDLDQSGCSSLANNGGMLKEIRVSCRRLDDVLSGERVDTMKVDVEGAELGVFRGGRNVIERDRPVIMFESGPGDAFGYSKEDLFSWFAQIGYVLFAPNRLAHTGGPLSLEMFLDSHEYPRRTTNYFALPSERSTEIRARARTALA